MKKLKLFIFIFLSMFLVVSVKAGTTDEIMSARNGTLQRMNTNANFYNLATKRLPRISDSGTLEYYFSLGCPFEDGNEGDCEYNTTYSGIQTTANGKTIAQVKQEWNNDQYLPGRWDTNGMNDGSPTLAKGSINNYSALYKNVGVYDGKTIDVKATVVAYEPMDNIYLKISEPAILFTKTQIGVRVTGVKWVRVRYDFINAATGQAITVKGNTTYWDIDQNQGIIIDNDNTNVRINYLNYGLKCLVSDETCPSKETVTNQLYYKVLPSGTYIFDQNSGINQSDRNPLYNDHLGSTAYAFSELFQGTSIRRTFQYSNPIFKNINLETYWNGHGGISLSSTAITHEITTEIVNGTINPNSPSDSPTIVAHGENLTVNYQCNSGYKLYSVKVDGVSKSTSTYTSQYSFTKIKADHHVAVVCKRQYTLTTIAHNGGIDNGGNFWENEDPDPINYYANNGYYLNKIEVDGTPVSITQFKDSYDFGPMTKNHKIEVWYIKHPTSPAKVAEKEVVNIDEDIVFEIDQELGNPGDPDFSGRYSSFIIEDILKDVLVADANKVVIKNESNEDVTDKFDITVNGQKITAAAKSVSLGDNNFYNHTYKMFITTKIKEGTTLEELSNYIINDKIIIKNQAVITIDDKPQETNEVHVEILSHKVVTSVVHGEIDPTPFVIVPHGKNINVTYTPEEGYALKSVWVDGKYVSIETYKSNYLFNNISQDHEVRVVYDTAYTITTEVVNGTINPDPSVVVAYGNDAIITYKPNNGYELSEIIIDGESTKLQGNEKEYIFKNVDANHHIKVIYKIKNVKTGLFEVGAVLLVIIGISTVTFISLKRKQIKSI